MKLRSKRTGITSAEHTRIILRQRADELGVEVIRHGRSAGEELLAVGLSSRIDLFFQRSVEIAPGPAASHLIHLVEHDLRDAGAREALGAGVRFLSRCRKGGPCSSGDLGGRFATE